MVPEPGSADGAGCVGLVRFGAVDELQTPFGMGVSFYTFEGRAEAPFVFGSGFVFSGSECGVESRVDGQDGVGAGYLEDLEDAIVGGDEAQFAAVSLHLAIEDHEETETCAVEEFDAGEVEDEFGDAFVGDGGDPGFDLAQAQAEGHASGETEDGRVALAWSSSASRIMRWGLS
jgi:hypothetical protein